MLPQHLLFMAILPVFTHASSLTIVNSCLTTVRPLLATSDVLPADVGYLTPGQSAIVEIADFLGEVYLDTGPGNGTYGQDGATKAVIDTIDHMYYILLDSGFSVGISITSNSTLKDGFCTPALCTSANCTDAMRISQPLANRTQAPTPMHKCPEFDVSHTVTFCPTASSPPAPSPSAVLIHPNGNNTKCLDVRGAQFTNGTSVQILDCNGTAGQRWFIDKGNTGVQVAGTNFCLDASSNPHDDVEMTISTCVDHLSAAQSWFYTEDNRIAVTGKGQCLDLTNSNLQNMNKVQTFKCTDSDTNQVWTTTTAS